ncbi:MAG TPA: hypothetical protein VHM30_05270 [Gemmatimonadaceae bacterium]|nr:hypothetical protein [Gemmatimonadaceae bacterium]
MALVFDSLSTPLKLRLGLVALAIVSPYWLGPLRIREKQKRAASPENMELVNDPAQVPAPLTSFVDQTRRTLESLGFAKTAVLRQRLGVVVLGESADGTIASGLALPKPDGTVHSLISYTTQLRGGRKIRTSNSSLPSTTPAPKGVEGLRLPDERDAARLLDIHRRLVARATRAGAQLQPLSVADPIAYQRREEQSSIAHAVGCGYWYRRGEQLALTWKGAFLSAWRMLPPWRTLAEQRDRRVAGVLLAARG